MFAFLLKEQLTVLPAVPTLTLYTELLIGVSLVVIGLMGVDEAARFGKAGEGGQVDMAETAAAAAKVRSSWPPCVEVER
jgi:hypothetical protein